MRDEVPTKLKLCGFYWEVAQESLLPRVTYLYYKTL